MGNALEFILRLQDRVSPGMRQAAQISQTASGKIVEEFSKIESKGNKMGASINELKKRLDAVNQVRSSTTIKEQFDAATKAAKNLEEEIKKVEGVKKESSGGINSKEILGGLGIGFGFMQIESMMDKGIEKAHQLHEAEAQLSNTMHNMGTYSDEAFEKVVKGAGDLSKNMLFSKAEVIALQSQLRMVGNVGETEMQRMTKDSADLASKFGMDLTTAGNMLAKGVNNPEMLRMLAQKIKIDPAIQAHLQALAKDGKDAQARLELLNIVEHQVGGAAAAAFNADPLARYNKVIGSAQLMMGNAAVQIQTTLAPVLEILAGLFAKVVSAVASVIDWLKQHSTVVGIVAAVIAGLIVTYTIYNGVLSIQSFLTKMATIENLSFASALEAVNLTFLANPVFWIIGGIIMLIAIIGYLGYAFDGWGKTWGNLMTFAKSTWNAYIDSWKLGWLQVKDEFMSGIELIEKGWYHLKSLWDAEGAKAGLASIDSQQNARAAEIAKQKGVLESDLKAAQASLKWEVHSNGKGLGTMVGDLKKHLGLGGATGEGVNPITQNYNDSKGGTVNPDAFKGKEKADKINSGGQRNITITIGKQIEKLEVHVMNAKEGAEEIGNMIKEELRRAIYSLNQTAS